jgi:serine/threonine-protein kinase
MKAGSLIEGKYRLVRVLGEGAMGVVWEATNEGTARQVAIKLVLRPTEELRHRLIREAKACGMLRHRNIVDLYDVGTTPEGDPFLVMELLVGETLAERLARQRRLDTPEATRIGRDVARALSAAHGASIIHRDLKPANIFLHHQPGEEASIVKVLDFGVSKNLATSDGLTTVVGGVVGSPAYMSPEQAGTGAPVDHGADIWSLGVVLFEMLTGKRPLEGDATTMIPRLIAAEIPPATTFLRTLDPALSALVARCLERDPSRRMGSAIDLATQLQRWTGAPLGAPSAPPAPPDLLVGAPEMDPMLRSPRLQGGQLHSAPRMPEGNKDENDDNQETIRLDPRKLAPFARPRAPVEPALPSTEKLEPVGAWSPGPTASSAAPSQDLSQGGTVRMSFSDASNGPPPPLGAAPVAPAMPPYAQVSTTAPLLQTVQLAAPRASRSAPLTKPRFTGTTLVILGSGAGLAIAALVLGVHALLGVATADQAPARPESTGVAPTASSVAPVVASAAPTSDAAPPKPPPPTPKPPTPTPTPKPPKPQPDSKKPPVVNHDPPPIKHPKGGANVPPWLAQKANPKGI